MAPTRYRIPPLQSGGLMLSYRCTNACRHCVYRCSPRQPDAWMAPDTAARVLDALADEPAFHGLHLAGGEATLNWNLLLQVIRMAVDRGVPLEYLETNASWCDDLDAARAGVEQLQDAGLRCLLVSVSMYHNEFVPLRWTKNCIRACREVLGAGGCFVYPSHLMPLVDRLPDDTTHTLAEFCRANGMAADSADLHDLFPLIPNGRPTTALRGFYTLQPAAAFRGDHCARTLQSPHHVHVDLYGNLFTGACAGICPGHVDDFHPAISAADTPIFHTLCERGPCGLLELAADFEPDPDGYAGKCDLCYRVRQALAATGRYPELTPTGFYTLP